MRHIHRQILHQLLMNIVWRDNVINKSTQGRIILIGYRGLSLRIFSIWLRISFRFVIMFCFLLNFAITECQIASLLFQLPDDISFIKSYAHCTRNVDRLCSHISLSVDKNRRTDPRSAFEPTPFEIISITVPPFRIILWCYYHALEKYVYYRRLAFVHE